MPELPEVETTLCGIKPHIVGYKVIKTSVRHPRLRWPIPADLADKLRGQLVERMWRRGKYILFEFKTGTLLLHLGMSGRVCVLKDALAPAKHDHVDIHFSSGYYLRFTDPRRFGALLWTSDDIEKHPLLIDIGPEPLTANFDGDYLWELARGRTAPVKAFIMDSKVVAGVGNIYATEALFEAQIHPKSAAGKVSRVAYGKLAQAIKMVLKKAIAKGGTTLKDFMKSDGSPGYFRIELKVYGRGGENCLRCGGKLKSTRIGQRSTVYCSHCQK